jgi:hypothetical protein
VDNQLPANPNLDNNSDLIPQPSPAEILDQSIAETQALEQEFQQRQAAAEAAMKAQQEDPGQLQPISTDQMAGVQPVEPQLPVTDKTTFWMSFEDAKAAGPEALEAWYLENTGRTKEEYAQMIAENHDFSGLMKAGEVAGTLALAGGLGVVDTVVDAMALPGVDRGGLGAEFNKWWDKNTAFKNPAYQAARDILGAIIPVAAGSKVATSAISATKMPRVQKALSIVGAEIGIDAAYMGVSDQGKEENLFRTLDDAFPWLQFPDDLKTLDDDSTSVRRIKNIYASTPFAIAGNILGSVLELGNKVPSFGWFKPKDEQAVAAKKALQQTNNDPETLVKLAEIDEAIASKTLTKAEVKELENTRAILQDQLENKGFSDVTSEPLETGVSRELDLNQIEMDEAAIRKLEADPFTVRYDPVITPALAKPGTVGRSGVKPGAAIRNAGDFTAINKGVTDGDPAPMVSEGMLSKFLKAGGRSRNAVLGLMEAARDAGDFDVVVDKFRFTKSQMDDEAYKWYTQIIGANDVEELRRSFPRDTKRDGQIKYLGEEATLGAAFAMRDLIDRYLGRPIAAQSARVMGTLGAEVRTLSESAQMFEGIVDENVVAEKVIDKLTMLTEEFALSKYVAGWQLQNKNFYDRVMGAADPNNLTQMTIAEFDVASSKAHQQAMNLRQMLTELKDSDPQLMKPLMDAFVLSNGNVDTIDKLTKWAFDNINPANYIANKDGMNLFSKSLTSIVLNNVLSGLSAGRAIIANSVALVQKPINSFLGTGLTAAFTKDADELRRFSYIHSGIVETNRRAMNNAWQTLKAVNADPTANIDLIRKDLRLFDSKTWDTVDDVAENVWKEQNKGKYAMYTWAKINKHVAEWPAMRWGTTAMSGADGYVNSSMASMVARIRAYDNLAQQGIEPTAKALRAAEKEAYAKMFDESGRMTDWAASHMSGEIALNLDNESANFISGAIEKAPLLRHLIMFPRTGLNALQVAGSYTVLAGETAAALALRKQGLSRYAKVLTAKTKDEIGEALVEHGLKNIDDDPNAMAIFEYLKREYRGRLAFSATLVAALGSYAMAGNIRGNGAVNPQERKLHRDSLGWKAKHIKLGGKWVPFAGLDTIEPILTLMGDYAFHARDISPEKSGEMLDQLIWTISATFLDKTYLKGLEPLIKIVNGDETALNKLIANTARGYIPAAGALGVAADAISASQKDIYNDFMGYLYNRVPVLNATLPEQIDFWTGKPLNDIDNPILRALNAISPIKVSDDQEPWRKWLFESGWDGHSMIRRDSTGKHEYTPEQREIIYRFMAEDNLGAEIASERFMGNQAFNNILGEVRDLKKNKRQVMDRDGNPIEYRVQLTPVHRAIDNLIRESKKRAEARLLADSRYADLAAGIYTQQAVDEAMKAGDIEGAFGLAQQRKQQLSKQDKIKQFSQYR